MTQNYLKNLEEESISIIRKTYSESNNPVILYSIGKDSSVLLHLFRKAFYPHDIPVPLLHVDTTWKFKEMIKFRDKISKKYNLKIYIEKNQNAISKNINPFQHKNYTDIMKTETLKTALSKHGFDFIYGGARRDEEASRSKERVLSVRDENHKWNPKYQRVEPWHIFNTNLDIGQSFRIFPLSNWTELDIWRYIQNEKIEVVPLYFAKPRKVVIRNKNIFLLDDNRFQINKDDLVKTLNVRFRTLGCYPLTLGVKSNADTIQKILNEIKKEKRSERAGRLIDKDKIGSMELKKKDGYF